MKTTDPTPPAPAAKACKACGEIKPLTAYFVAQLYADGYTPRCRRCVIGAVPPRREVAAEGVP